MTALVNRTYTLRVMTIDSKVNMILMINKILFMLITTFKVNLIIFLSNYGG